LNGLNMIVKFAVDINIWYWNVMLDNKCIISRSLIL
jgi:hypothetical protein